CFAWSPDGLLLAFPAASEGGVAWRIIDAATGQTVRESEVFKAGTSPWCAAQLDRTRLRAVTEDGLLFEMPIQPSMPARKNHLTSGDAYRLFSPDGKELIELRSGDKRDPSQHMTYRIRDEDLD